MSIMRCRIAGDLIRLYSNGVIRRLTVCTTIVRQILWAIGFFATTINITILSVCEHSQFLNGLVHIAIVH